MFRKLRNHDLNGVDFSFTNLFKWVQISVFILFEIESLELFHLFCTPTFSVLPLKIFYTQNKYKNTLNCLPMDFDHIKEVYMYIPF